MKQQGKMKIAELQYPKQHDDEQSREAYLIVKIKSSEKNAAYFFPNFISIKHMLS